MKKKYYYTIGEVCNLLNLKAHTLRFWESEFSQLHPQKNDGRNRRYTQNDIDLIKKIQHLLHNQKYTISGARKKLKNKKEKQIELDFTVDKSVLKEKIKKELRVIKELLK